MAETEGPFTASLNTRTTASVAFSFKARRKHETVALIGDFQDTIDASVMLCKHVDPLDNCWKL